MPRGDAEHERQRDVVWALVEAQPENPRLGVLARELLLENPEDSGMDMALAFHLQAVGDLDGARAVAGRVLARGDKFWVRAIGTLREVEDDAENWEQALHWAQEESRAEPEAWGPRFHAARYASRLGRGAVAWDQLEGAVADIGRLDPDELPWATGMQAAELMLAWAPLSRFIPAAEAAIRLDPTNEYVAIVLAWAYLASYRFDDSEREATRVLRLDPTNEAAQGVLATSRRILGIIRDARDNPELGYSEDELMDMVRANGVVEQKWREFRAETLGVDIASAIAALERCLPDDLRAVLAPGAEHPEKGERVLLTWHDGQQPGSGELWRWQAGPFRLMSAREVKEMDDEIEDDPDWPDDEFYEQIATDDAGAYLITVAFGRVVIRRPGSGQADEPVAETLADWLWDRVRDLGGEDARAGLPPHDHPDLAAGAH